MLLSLELGWPDPLQGLSDFKICLYLIYGIARLALTADSQGSVQAG